jgi:hypothetical protein
VSVDGAWSPLPAIALILAEVIEAGGRYGGFGAANFVVMPTVYARMDLWKS